MTEKAPVRVGIVGCGFMGLTHIKALQKIEEAEIAAICDAVRLPEDGDFSEIGGNIGDEEPVKLDMTRVKATKDMNDLLEDPDIDLINLCVPTSAHPSLAIAALKAGKHVVCEKPLARTSALAREIVEAADAAEGYFMPAMCLRFWPEWAWLKQAIDEGTYGKVMAARFRRVAEPPGWSKDFMDGEKSGGAILDLHIHDADFVQYCFGRPSAVYASGFTLKSGAIDHVAAQYVVEGGASVSAEGGWVMHEGFGFNMEYTVICERATIDYTLTRGEEPLKVFQDGKPAETVTPPGGDGYIGELKHMVDCIQNGTPPSLVTGVDGLSAVEIIEAEEESIREGKFVAL